MSTTRHVLQRLATRAGGGLRRINWIDLSGWTTTERRSLETRLWESGSEMGGRRQRPSLIVGYHPTANTTDGDDDDHEGWKHPQTTTVLWTTLLGSEWRTTTTPAARDDHDDHSSPHLLLHQAWLQSLHARQQQQDDVAAPPRKTLVVESKACCGVGVSGKILDLNEIRSKREALRTARSHATTRLTTAVPDASPRRARRLSWDGQPLAGHMQEYDDDDDGDGFLRTRLAWDGPVHDDDDDDRLLYLRDMYPDLRPRDAIGALRDVAEEVWEVDTPTPDDALSEDLQVSV